MQRAPTSAVGLPPHLSPPHVPTQLPSNLLRRIRQTACSRAGRRVGGCPLRQAEKFALTKWSEQGSIEFLPLIINSGSLDTVIYAYVSPATEYKRETIKRNTLSYYRHSLENDPASSWLGLTGITVGKKWYTIRFLNTHQLFFIKKKKAGAADILLMCLYLEIGFLCSIA